MTAQTVATSCLRRGFTAKIPQNTAKHYIFITESVCFSTKAGVWLQRNHTWLGKYQEITQLVEKPRVRLRCCSASILLRAYSTFFSRLRYYTLSEIRIILNMLSLNVKMLKSRNFDVFKSAVMKFSYAATALSIH